MLGKFIIIEGGNGSGKTTQLHLLKEALEKVGIKVKTLDFPQYDQFWGKTVGRFLKGEFGGIDDVNPYIIAPHYLLDQASQSQNIKQWIAEGYWVLSNRYVTSSMAHQTCKFKNKEERDNFLHWLSEAAYDRLGLIKEDLTIVLSVDPNVAKELAKGSRARKASYTDGVDIEEDDPNHQIDSVAMYKVLVNKYDSWRLIECMDPGGKIKSIEEIHNLIIKLLESSLKINLN